MTETLFKPAAALLESCDGLIGWMAVCNDRRIERQIVDVGPTRKFLQAEAFAVNFDHEVIALVLILLLSGGPAAIAWGVWPRVVDSVERTSFRSWSHVSQECREVAAPFGAHSDPATTVDVEVRDARVFAAIYRRTPRLILSSSAGSVLGVELSSSDQHFSFQTTAALGVSAQSSRVNQALLPALAVADPLRLPSLRVWASLNNSQSAERLSSLIDETHSPNYPTQVSS